MSGRKLVNAAYQDQNWIDETESKNILKTGWFGLGLTNMDNNSLPAIQAGSTIDIDGVIYKFDTEEAISGTAVEGDNFVVVSGGETATASFTTDDLPIWDYIKLGYYGTSGERYVGAMLKSGIEYTDKIIINSDSITI